MKVTNRAFSPRTRVVTQTLTRPFTTITAVVTLGDGPPPTATPPPPTPSHSAETIAPAPHSGSLTPSQLGALLGSVFGLAFIALLVCCFISFNRKRQRRTSNPPEYYYDYDGDSVSESEVVQVETAGWTLRQNRGGGGRGVGWGGGGTAGGAVRGAWTTVPPPVRFPPTPRHAGYSQTREQQIGGVRRYP